jgi:Fe-S-cluster containining protein
MTNERTPLAMVPTVSCDGCGACCLGIGTPPGFFAAYSSPQWDGVFLADEPDHETWLAMPDEIRRSLSDYYGAVDRGEVADRSAHEVPCLWYDPEKKSCRHYEWRPIVCHEFEVGGEDCLRMRAEPPVI